MRFLPLIFCVLGLAVTSTRSFADWNTVLVCDGGKVWVDVDSNNRTRLQLISRDSAANHYVNQTLHAHSTFQNGGFGSFETGWTGVQPTGVFANSDFAGATGTYTSHSTYPTNLNGQYLLGYTEYVSFFKIDGGKLKLQVTRSNVQKCVDNLEDGRFSKCTRGIYTVANEYVGDWVFENCQ